MSPGDSRMTSNELPAEAVEALDEILNRDDPHLVGILLSGSAARGMATKRSDIDITLYYDQEMELGVTRSRFIDEVRGPIDGWSEPASFGTDAWYQRWASAWPLILRDTPDGKVARQALARATLTEDEQWPIVLDRVDGYLNLVYRALKSHRDGRILERDLDAMESVPWLLDTIFPICGRVRPYNKYLAWELREHPLPVPEWSAEFLIPQIQATIAGDIEAIRDVFAVIERECLAFDAAHNSVRLRDTFADWGEELDDLRRTN